jgi:hypothetical protein
MESSLRAAESAMCPTSDAPEQQKSNGLMRTPRDPGM